jgi:hypothetical protein
MKTKIFLFLCIVAVTSIQSTPDPEDLNPLLNAEQMSYRWCVKSEKSDKSRLIFQTFLEVKNYMRVNNLSYVYIQDCFVDEMFYKAKYKRLTRIWKKDNVHGEVYDNNCNAKN